MDTFRVLEVKESIFEDNDKRAEALREELGKKKCFFVNVMSSPGSGKTTTLVSLINHIKDRLTCGVMEADIDSDVDAKTIMDETGARAIQLHTGGMCHLDSDMTREGMDGMGIDGIDLLFLENIGNLVCPAEFDTGAHLNLVILSVPEGDDKPVKYPLMFEVADLVVINKVDTLPIFDFDMERACHVIHERNKNADILKISAKKDIGMKELADYLYEKVISLRKQNN